MFTLLAIAAVVELAIIVVEVATRVRCSQVSSIRDAQ